MEDETAPMFTARYRGHGLHMRVPIDHLASCGENRAQMALTAASASIWLSFTQKAAKEALKEMRLKIPGGKMIRK